MSPRNALLGILLLASSATAQTFPATAPATYPPGVDNPGYYDQLIAQLTLSANAKSQAVETMKAKLRELSDPANPSANDAAKRELLVRRRLADQQYESSRRAFEIYWLERSLTPAQKAEFQKLSPEDREALLEVRTPAHRLHVPLAAKRFTAATAEEVFAYVAEQDNVRVVVDWPAIAALGLQRRTAITTDVGPYIRPGLSVLQEIVTNTTGGKAIVDLSRAEAAIITTPTGQKLIAELDRKLNQRASDIRAWDNFGDVLPPVNLRQVPLGDALAAGIPAGQFPPLYIDWVGLAEAGITPKTPVDLVLGPHTIGHRLAILADAMDERPEVKRLRGMRFDVHPTGEIIFSTLSGFEKLTTAVNRVASAANTDESREALFRRIPEVRFDGVDLQDAIDFLKEASRIEIRPDWKSLAACGFTPKSPVQAQFVNTPLAFVLGIIMDTQPGKPEVRWDVTEQRLEAKGPEPKQ